MIYETAKQLAELGIDWTPGVNGIEMICKHSPNKCPFFFGSHKPDELIEWPDFEQMSKYIISKTMGFGFSYDNQKKEWRGVLNSVFDKIDLMSNDSFVRSSDMREIAAKLIIKIHS